LLQDALAVKSWMDWLKELQSYGSFNLRETDFPQIFSTPWWKNYELNPQKFYRCKNKLESSITMLSLVGLRLHPPLRQPKHWAFLFACASDMVAVSVYSELLTWCPCHCKVVSYMVEFIG